MQRIFCSLLLFGAALLVAPAAASAVTIDWSYVGNPGNANDTVDAISGTPGIQTFGGVPYAYNIGTYDVTVNQWVEFLNTKASHTNDPYGFYRGPMSSQITRSGDALNYSYVANQDMGNKPVTLVSWYNALRFTNWLNNGQGDADTETGAYTLNRTVFITRNPGAQVFLPNDNEWYKAALYDPRTTAQGGPPADSHYWLYGTSSNDPPIDSAPTALPNHANYLGAANGVTDVGAYSGTTSPSGAFDMVGTNNYTDVVTGQSVQHNPIVATWRTLNGLNFWGQESVGLGSGGGRIRLASVAINVPEPSTGLLAVLACGMLWWWRKRFK